MAPQEFLLNLKLKDSQGLFLYLRILFKPLSKIPGKEVLLELYSLLLLQAELRCLL